MHILYIDHRRIDSARLDELDQGTDEQQPSISEGEEEDEDAQEGDAFHSLRHVKPFAKEAARALDLVEVAARKGAHRRRAPCVPLQRFALHFLPMLVHEHVLQCQKQACACSHQVSTWPLALYVIRKKIAMQPYVIR